MKYRNSFVTNSSSSSYIIAIKNENNKLPKDIEEKLLEWAKKEVLSGFKISTIEELDKFFVDEHNYRRKTLQELLDDDEDLKEEYLELKQKIEEGFVIYKNWISCEGQDENLYMYNRAFNLLKESPNFDGIDTDLYY